MKIDESLKKEIEEEVEKVQTPSSLYEFAKNIKDESEKRVGFETPIGRKKGWRKSKFAVAAIISLGILTGSAFLNPTMAEMASKIPYIGQIFQKPIYEVILETLDKEGYKYGGIGMSMWDGKPSFDIELKGTEEYVKQEEEKVLAILTEILEKKGYDNYRLNISDTNVISPVSKEIYEKRDELGEKLMQELQGAGYTIMSVNALGPVFSVYIPIADKAKEVEIYKAAIELLKANGTPQQVQVITRDALKEEIEYLWSPVMWSIEEELYLKKEYQVADIKYSYKPEKVSITVMTNMEPSEVNTKETVAKIRKEITEFLDSEEIKTMTKNQKYELVVQDKNGEDFPI